MAKTRGRNAFKQTDVTRALKAAFAAGAGTARVEVAPDGRLIIVAERTQIADKATHSVNEWDTV